MFRLTPRLLNDVPDQIQPAWLFIAARLLPSKDEAEAWVTLVHQFEKNGRFPVRLDALAALDFQPLASSSPGWILPRAVDYSTMRILVQLGFAKITKDPFTNSQNSAAVPLIPGVQYR